jgi:hypothetical protein
LGEKEVAARQGGSEGRVRRRRQGKATVAAGRAATVWASDKEAATVCATAMWEN